MIINRAGGTRGKTTAGGRKAAARHHVQHLLRYLTQQDKYGQALEPFLTNCSGSNANELTAELEAWKTLRPSITEPLRHKIFSPEKGDRELSKDEWQKMIDIYREERGLEDAPYVAFLHTDGHGNRNPAHLHLAFLRIRSDGSVVPDSLDFKVDRQASRRIEHELDLVVNRGASRRYKTLEAHTDFKRRRRSKSLYNQHQAPVAPRPARTAVAQAGAAFSTATSIAKRFTAAIAADASRAARRADDKQAAAKAISTAADESMRQKKRQAQAQRRRKAAPGEGKQHYRPGEGQRR